MGKITEALKKTADERIARIQKKPEVQYVVKRVENTKIDDHIVSFHDPTSPITEQYKILRTNMQTLKKSKGYKTFIITSAINGEGKTVTSINLAMAMAHDLNNKSILLIDADLRKGKIAKYLGIKKHKGLTEILNNGTSEEAAFISPDIKNLTILLSGAIAKNPSELLNSKKMQSLLGNFKKKFDYVIIDAPPVLPLTDACILAPMTDGALLVVQSGRTQKDAINHAESRLKQAGANTLGIIMTNIEYHLPQYLYRYMQHYGEYKYEDK